jgi:hypothetical protein
MSAKGPFSNEASVEFSLFPRLTSVLALPNSLRSCAVNRRVVQLRSIDPTWVRSREIDTASSVLLLAIYGCSASPTSSELWSLRRDIYKTNVTFETTVVSVCTNSINIPLALTFSFSAFYPQCIWMFRVILRRNSDYFLEQHQPIDRCHGDALCFLWGRNWIFGG